MKKSLQLLLLCMGCTTIASHAQSVDLTQYTDYSPLTQPDSSLLVYGSAHQGKAVDVSLRPDHVNNMESKHFPPVFNQAGGSCGSASRIGYMFTHEMNAYRGTDASFMENCYPTHFVWLLTSGNSGKGEFMKQVGIPSAVAYGGRTYSELFGNQSEKDEAFGWMNGYEKWYSGMFNRMEKVTFIPANLGTKEGREALKNWLWNHNGDTEFSVGGVAGIGVATGSLTTIPSTPTNDESGVTGLKCVEHWGDQVNHALTIVGYDDRVEFDLNGNGVYGETDADEKGAWIIVNSWGTKWGNGGAVYCPYAYGGKRFNLNEDGSYTFDPRNWWNVETLTVRKDYRPLRTIKVKMDYNRRSELRLSAGVSADLSATTPEQVQLFHHFNYAGDGNKGETNPAPLVPMLGRWADGKLHDEPMEFGYDLTDLTAGYDRCQPLKYFFIIETKLWSCGEGHVYEASLMDYEFDDKGIEYPFDMEGNQVKIESKGHRTVISVIVKGEGYYAPRNLQVNDQVLSWESPQSMMYQIDSYNIYRNGAKLAQVKANALQYALEAEAGPVTYGVSAVYEGNKESKVEKIAVAAAASDENTVLHLQRGGLVVPDVYNQKYDQSTIEFWISPDTTATDVLEAGPGFGEFYFNIGAKGVFTVGWDNDKTNKIVTGANTFLPHQWTHVAMVVDGKRLTLYINGRQLKNLTSKRYSGVGGFGDLVFRTSKKLSAIRARMDEIRIWNYAKSAQEIADEVRVTYPGQVYPNGLLRYYKGDVVPENYASKCFESVSGQHADITGLGGTAETAADLQLNAPVAPVDVRIQAVTGTVQVGTPLEMEAVYAPSVTDLTWNVPGLKVMNLHQTRPSFVFQQAGDYEVTVSATNAAGASVADTCTVQVVGLPKATADFHLSKEVVTLGERVTFHVDQPVDGYRYEWSMPGADVEQMVATHAAASYLSTGQHEVTLAAISPAGEKVSATRQLSVELVAPVAEFTISQAVMVKGETTFLYDQSKFNPDSWQWLISSEKKNLVINGQNSSLTMEQPGVYDVSLTAANEKGKHTLTRSGALIVCNAESETGLNFDHASSQVVLSAVPLSAQQQFTIEWWMNPDRISTYCNGIGDQEQTFLLKNDGDGVLSLFLNGLESKSPRKYVIPYQWHHYAVSFASGSVKFYRDGVLQSTTQNATVHVPALQKFVIGVEHNNMSGMIDEFRIWENCLTEEELQQYANAPIADVATAEKELGLKLYYNFNQANGDVHDATSNGNTGVRKGFGPDGDAWILSSGVFCLNFDPVVRKEVTSQYLKNTQAPFKHDTQHFTNDAEPDRFYAITDWTLENTVTQGKKTSGVYVDGEKDYCFTCQTGWEGFANLSNHKVYQTVTLPAGDYEWIANYGKWKSGVKNTVLAAALGKGLPNAKDCDTEALASTVMAAKSQQVTSNSIHFVLKEDTEVSLGLVLNMQGRLSFVLHDFQLTCAEFENIPADGAAGFTLSVGANGYAAMALPYSVLLPEGVAAYVATDLVDGKVQLQQIEDGVIPAMAGVVISALPGDYHFVPTSKSGMATSLLKGNAKEMETDQAVRYYVFDNQETPCFKLWTATVLPAQQVYFTSDLADTHEVYLLDDISLGIEQLPADHTAADDWYDVSGRKVKQLNKGIYISKGSKICK